MTLAHAAAVVPLRRYFPLPALVVGSFVPDFEFFFRLLGFARFSHTLPAIAYFCVPVGLLCLWFFEAQLQLPVIRLLPVTLRRRIRCPRSELGFWSVARLRGAAMGIAVGSLTHVIWDSFTHEYGWAVEHIPLLQGNVGTIYGTTITLSLLLQYLSSLLGLLVLLQAVRLWMRHNSLNDNPEFTELPERLRSRIVFLIAFLTLVAGLGVGCSFARYRAGVEAVLLFLVQGVIASLITATLCLVLYSLWNPFRRTSPGS